MCVMNQKTNYSFIIKVFISQVRSFCASLSKFNGTKHIFWKTITRETFNSRLYDLVFVCSYLMRRTTQVSFDTSFYHSRSIFPIKYKDLAENAELAALLL